MSLEADFIIGYIVVEEDFMMDCSRCHGTFFTTGFYLVSDIIPTKDEAGWE